MNKEDLENTEALLGISNLASKLAHNSSLHDVSHQRKMLIAFAKYMEEDKMYERHDEANVDDFLDNYKK